MLYFIIAVVLLVAAFDDLTGVSHALGPIKKHCHIRMTFRGMLFLLAGLLVGIEGCKAF